MMRTMSSAAGRASVSLLEEYSPQVLDVLRNRLPTFRAQLLPDGQVLGDELLRVDTVSCVAALDVAIRLCESAVKMAARRIAPAKVVALSGAICSTVSSAAIFTVVA